MQPTGSFKMSFKKKSRVQLVSINFMTNKIMANEIIVWKVSLVVLIVISYSLIDKKIT